MQEKLWVRKASGLVRSLTPLDALLYAFACPGIFYVAIWILWNEGLYPGSNYVLASLAMLVWIPIAICYIQFSSAMPRSGADYVYVSRIIGPGWGFFGGWTWCALLVGSLSDCSHWGIATGISDMFYILGLQTGNRDLVSAVTGYFTGAPLSLNPGAVPSVSTFAAMIVFVTICFVISSRMKAVKYLVWICAIWMFLALAVYTVLGLTTSLETIKANMYQMTGVTYDSVIQEASSLGWQPGLSSPAATVTSGLTYVALAVVAWNFIANVAGEVKNNQRAQMIGQPGALILCTAFSVLFGLATYTAFTKDFTSALGFLVASGRDYDFFKITLTMTHMAGFMTTNPIIAIIPASGVLATSLGIVTTFAATLTRNVFAFSFDGILPTSFSRVDRRGIPWVATIIGIIAAWISLAVYMFTRWFQFIAYLIVLYAIAYGVTAIAAIVFPWRKKALFDAAPTVTNKKIGGVPIMTILGLVSLAVCVGVMWSTIGPTLSGGFTVAFQNVVVTTIVWLVPAWVIYGLSRAYSAKRGIPLALRFKEIPPE